MKTPGKLLFVLGLGASAASALPLRAQEHVVFALPLACEAHKTCFIQSYVDTDPGPAVKDYACGAASYDKNNGVDFRLLSAEAARVGVPVLAAAAGKVKATRDGMADQFLRAAKPGDVKGRECGNGVVIEHGDGWETQYCHLMKGSIPVSKGQAVGKGEKLGFVGYSGMADFAHLHFVVRHNGQVIDPFAPEAGPGACAAAGKPVTLWEPAVPAAFGYRNGEIIATGFTHCSTPVKRTAVAGANTGEYVTRIPCESSATIRFFELPSAIHAISTRSRTENELTACPLTTTAAELRRTKLLSLGFRRSCHTAALATSSVYTSVCARTTTDFSATEPSKLRNA